MINTSLNSGYVACFEGDFGLFSFRVIDKKISLKKVLKGTFF